MGSAAELSHSDASAVQAENKKKTVPSEAEILKLKAAAKLKREQRAAQSGDDDNVLF